MAFRPDGADGAWVSPFWTLTEIMALSPICPMVSVARARIEWLPLVTLVESQTVVYGEVVEVPMLRPSTKYSTLVTPLSSVALTVMDTEPVTGLPFSGLVMIESSSPQMPAAMRCEL